MRAFALVVIVLVTGCAHVEKTAFDVRSSTFQLCGNKWAGREDFDKKASQSCGRPELQSCARSERGYVSQPFGAGTVTKPVYGTCCSYQCR